MPIDIKDIQAALDSSDEDAIYEAIIQLGKYYRSEHANLVIPFLKHPSEQIREAAIYSLTFYWRITQFENEAKEIFHSAQDIQLKRKALSGWMSYYWETGNKEKMAFLVDIMKDNSVDNYIRKGAYLDFLAVSTLPKEQYPSPFNDSIDWELVNSILES